MIDSYFIINYLILEL